MKKAVAVFLLFVMLLCTSCGGASGRSGSDTGITSAPDTEGKAGSDSQTPDAGKAEEMPTAAPTPIPDNFEGKTLKFDTSVRYQTIDGFGAGYTWYAERLLKSEYSSSGFDALFNDSRLTILRFKNEYEYYIENKAGNISTVASYYKEARDRAAKYGEKVKVLMCCWSPPAKLKSDNSIDVGDGTLRKDADGNYCYEEYADWWVESLKYYMSRGIQIDYVSIQNEVDFAPDDYEGCLFAANETEDKASYSKAFLAVYFAMKEAFGDDAPKLLGPETMTCAPATLSSYTKEIRETAPEALDGYAFHLYQGGSSDSATMTVSPSSFFNEFSNMTLLLGDTRKWQTEFYIGHGIQTAELIHNCLTNAQMNAYIYWGGVWADSPGNTFESADLIEVNAAGEWRTSANYYALRHFSEFIRPGYDRIDAKSGASSVKASAYASPDNTKLAFVLVNPGDEEFTYRIKSDDYTVTDSRVYTSVFGDECEGPDGLYQDCGPLSEGGVFTLPAKSVVTLDVTGYAGSVPMTPEPVKAITYDTEVITDAAAAPVPDSDTVIIDTAFTDKGDITGFTSFGSSMSSFAEGMGTEGDGALKVSGRTAAWNGIVLSQGYFEHYGYMLYVSYDCMTENGGQTISCTSSFDVNKSTQYPSTENTRVSTSVLKAGEWTHAEGYMTMFSNMDPESFKIYWETGDNTDDFYLDNVQVRIMYTMPAGEFSLN